MPSIGEVTGKRNVPKTGFAPKIDQGLRHLQDKIDRLKQDCKDTRYEHNGCLVLLNESLDLQKHVMELYTVIKLEEAFDLLAQEHLIGKQYDPKKRLARADAINMEVASGKRPTPNLFK